MLKSFLFGQFGLRLNCGNKFMALLPSNWQKYATKEPPVKETVLLCVEDALFPLSTRIPNGWTLQSNNNSEQLVVYSQDNKPVFALQYDDWREKIIILVTSTLNRSVLSGLQFGLLTALHQKSIGLHGVTLLCHDEIIILSAPSGTGKTTLSHLLETYCDALVINGDFALLSISDEDVVFEPTPFCGTSRRCLNQRVKINRIIFLEQAKDNIWISLDGRQSLRRCLDNIFIPEWDPSMVQSIHNAVMRLISLVKISSFAFAPTKKAAILLYNRLND